jgi:glycosyltransferase involved in cell wall biosynthesis
LDALLVIAGPVREPDQLAKATDSVKVLGWISADDKAPLYSGASAAVSVAKHEGFGMLPLEAFACGTQSILSPLSVYRETLGDQAIYVSSDDPDAIAESLIAWRASTPAPDAAEVEQLRAKFSWDKCARDSLCEILKAIE